MSRQAKEHPVPSASPGEASLTWRERLAALRYLPGFLELVWESHRGYTTVMVTLRLARALVPVVTLWMGRLIIDTVVLVTRGEPVPSALWWYLAIEIAVVVADDVLARGSTLVEGLLGERLSNHSSMRLMEHASTLDLEQFENPEVQDRLERARAQTADRLGLLAQLLGIGQDFVTLLTLGVAVLAYSVWLALLVFLAVLPSSLAEAHFAARLYALRFRTTPQRRQLNYLRWVGSSPEIVKEVKMFGLAPWLVGRYRVVADRLHHENALLLVRRGTATMVLSLFGTAGYYVAYVSILLAAVRGGLSIGQLTFLAASFARSRDLTQRLLQAVSGIHEQCLYLRDLFTFLQMRPRIVSRPGARPVPLLFHEGFSFEDVGFRYPGSQRWAVRHVSFRLRPGERIALVGENGAGKTTLTKLLARLYDPTEGRITLEGVDLREYELSSLHRAIGVVFQDLVGYAMRFDENIGVGEIDGMRSYLDAEPGSRFDVNGGPPSDAAVPEPIRSAAERSLASTLLPRLAGGYRQMLGRYFDGGVGLSGGEWQKIALARAYMRDAQVMILDEPTAALDARAEFEAFTRFAELMDGRMAVLVSHRFSTVRMADRIVVLAEGAVVEEGTHEDLIARRGTLYAELFGMQAAGYR